MSTYINLPEQKLLDKAVHGAASGGHTLIVSRLLNRGADLKIALEAATIEGHTTLVKMLEAMSDAMDDVLLESVLDSLDDDGYCPK